MLMLAIERVRSSRPEVFYKKVFLKISQNLQENTCARIFINKETLAQVFSYEFCEIFKNTFFYRTLPGDSSDRKIEGRIHEYFA